MNKFAAVLRFVLGLVYAVFGANHLTPFLEPPGDAPPEAAAFGAALGATGYMWELVGLTQLVGGLLLWIPRTVPLGLVVLMPVTVNVVLYHALLDPNLTTAFVGYAVGGLHLVLLRVDQPFEPIVKQ